MIRAIFTVQDKLVTGFEISGHSGFSKQGSDIICSAVSSAAYMAVNTLTDVQKLDCDVAVNDGFMDLKLSKAEAEAAQVVLNGLLLHLDALSKEYADFIDLKISEV